MDTLKKKKYFHSFLFLLFCFITISSNNDCDYRDREDVPEKDPNYYIAVSPSIIRANANKGTYYLYITTNYPKCNDDPENGTSWSLTPYPKHVYFDEGYNPRTGEWKRYFQAHIEEVGKKPEHPAPLNTKYKTHYFRACITHNILEIPEEETTGMKICCYRYPDDDDKDKDLIIHYLGYKTIKVVFEPSVKKNNVPPEGSEQTQDYKRQLENL